MDYKNEELAHLIVNSSLQIKPGTKVYLKYKTTAAMPLIKYITEEIYKKGGTMFPYYFDKELEDFRLKTMTDDSIDACIRQIAFQNDFFDVFVSIGSNDEFKKANILNHKVINHLKLEKLKLESLKNNKQWLLLNYPSIVDAQRLGMSYEEYYQYAMDAMTYDFSSIMPSIMELKRLLDETKIIRIIGDNVDLTFSKEGISSVPLLGNVNLPDGEIYTSPVRNSVNGYIRFNVPSPKENLIFEDVLLLFKDGKVVDFSCKDHREEFEHIISVDENAKYIGEFAFGFNPMVKQPMNDILYDEKLIGSFHMALGNSYQNAFNGNVSALHWDLIYLNTVQNQCSIYFDDSLVYTASNFVLPKMKKLNR